MRARVTLFCRKYASLNPKLLINLRSRDRGKAGRDPGFQYPFAVLQRDDIETPTEHDKDALEIR